MVAGAVVLLLTVGVIGVAWLREQRQIPPLPFEERCVATAPGGEVVLTLDQAHWVAIVVGVGVERDIGEHGATIAMATVYQETGIRNLDYGDRDSVGLFQQRPSQDWGTPQQIMDPWYSSAQFYDALVEVPDWENGDVNDMAQAVQRSGHPEAYRKHESKARVLAQVFTGAVPAGLSCFDERTRRGDVETFRGDVHRTFGRLPLEIDGATLRVRATSAEHARAVAAYAVANAGRLGITGVQNGGQSWRPDHRTLPRWTAGSDTPEDSVVVTFR
ncbi:hypothetical protein [Granulicoccus sp. GXG6511]|uniref:hypothetical protein n=1 Tax=Granulicoccus sp. GXG6511 TaxID=3381351 RepID=UPI003D7CACA7